MPGRAAEVRSGLEAAGCSVVAVATDATRLTELVRASDAEIIVCDIDDPSRDALESMGALYRDEPRPVVLFAEKGAPEQIAAALEAGVAAYVVEGLSPAKVRPVLEVASLQFKAYQTLRHELNQARSSLAHRETIERAKQRLMRDHRLSEPEAHKRLQRMAMEKGMKLLDVAMALLSKT